jgi:hypothetical protein
MKLRSAFKVYHTHLYRHARFITFNKSMSRLLKYFKRKHKLTDKYYRIYNGEKIVFLKNK